MGNIAGMGHSWGKRGTGGRNEPLMNHMNHHWGLRLAFDSRGKGVPMRSLKGSERDQADQRDEPDRKPTNATQCRTFNKAGDVVHGKGCLSHSIGITDCDLKMGTPVRE